MRTPPERLGFAVATWAVLIAMVVVVFQLVRDPSWRASEVAAPPIATVPRLGDLGRPSRQLPHPPATAANLLSNGSFEEDLSGWRPVGPALADRILGGRASGVAAAVRLAYRSPMTLVGLEFPGAIRSAPLKSVYVATVWIRSAMPGLEVSVSLVASSRRGMEGTKVSARTVRDGRWRRVSVRHRVSVRDADVGVLVTAPKLPVGETFELDEVVVRQA